MKNAPKTTRDRRKRRRIVPRHSHRSHIAYLRWQADFHAREADRFSRKAQSFDRNALVWESDDWRSYSHHQRLLAEYRAAISRPSILLDEKMRTDPEGLSHLFLHNTSSP